MNEPLVKAICLSRPPQNGALSLVLLCSWPPLLVVGIFVIWGFCTKTKHADEYSRNPWTDIKKCPLTVWLSSG